MGDRGLRWRARRQRLVGTLRPGLSQLPYLPRTLALVWDVSPRLTTAWVLLLVVQGLLPAAAVILTRALVNSLVLVIESGGDWTAIRPTLFLALLMAGILLLTELLRSASNWVRAAEAELVQDHVSQLIHAKSIEVDLAFYDLPDYFDQLHRAQRDASYRPVALLEGLGSLLQNGITLVAMAAILVPYGWWLPLALLLSTLPALFVVVRHTLRQYHWWLATTPDQRRTSYFDWLLTSRDSAAELRLFQLGPHFQSSYRTLRRRLRTERLRLVRSQGLAELLASASGLLVTGVVMLWMVWQTLQGLATLGDLALFYQAFSQGQRIARTLLENVGQIYNNMLFLGAFFEFLGLEPTVKDPAAEGSPRSADRGPEMLGGVGMTVDFQQVSFAYPGGRRAVLQDLTLHAPAGQITAIVGSNGSGKSTLVKLLCRFYDPQAGCVALNGVDLRDLGVEELRRQITVLFQTPVQYNATVAENIALGDLAQAAGPAQIEQTAASAGVDQVAARLPQGYDTLLGIWFHGGTDLSVGEWQRVALARAYLRHAPVMVLDEPTSAMDPWAEADWLRRLRAMVAGRTTLIITHRFSTAKHADVIHVMEAGRVVESGSHTELLALGGRYAQGWQDAVRLSTLAAPGRNGTYAGEPVEHG